MVSGLHNRKGKGIGEITEEEGSLEKTIEEVNDERSREKLQGTGVLIAHSYQLMIPHNRLPIISQVDCLIRLPLRAFLSDTEVSYRLSTMHAKYSNIGNG